MPVSPPPLPFLLSLTMNPSVDIATHTEHVRPADKLRCGVASRDAGGGGLNVAHVITTLGGRCTALFPAGGASGLWLQHRLEQDGLSTLCVPINGETRESFTVQDNSTGEEYRFVMTGPQLSEAEWTACLQRIAQLRETPAYVIASGSLPPGVPVDFYARLARQCKAKGSRLVLDSSGEALAAALHEGVYLVKPNLRELSDLVGRELDTPALWQAAARDLVARGQAQTVALSLGERGAFVVTAGQAWSAEALPVAVESSVGAGDSFVGALVGSLAQGDTLEQAFAWAMAAGTATLLQPGTGLCQLTDVQRLRPQVRVQAVPAP
jgi:6-phosphofructokinase 2